MDATNVEARQNSTHYREYIYYTQYDKKIELLWYLLDKKHIFQAAIFMAIFALLMPDKSLAVPLFLYIAWRGKKYVSDPAALKLHEWTRHWLLNWYERAARGETKKRERKTLKRRAKK